MLADALLRSVTGTTALLRVTGANTDSSQSEVGLVATTFAEVVVSPVVMRKLRPHLAGKWRVKVGAADFRDWNRTASKCTEPRISAGFVCDDSGGYRDGTGLPD